MERRGSFVLTDLEFKTHYRGRASNFFGNVYIPCLENSIRFDRAVGYFSGGVFVLARNAIESFVERGGVLRVIASPHLSPADVEQIELGYERREIIARAFAEQIDLQTGQQSLDGLGLLGSLIAKGALELRLATVGSSLYHEKFGVFYDEAGNSVSYHGSSNETTAAYRKNYERDFVNVSWLEGQKDIVNDLTFDFETTWMGENTEIQIYDIPEYTLERLKEHAVDYEQRKRLGLIEETEEDGISVIEPTLKNFEPYAAPHFPKNFELRDYQKTAIKNWFEANGRGIWDMATGTGKTKTALSCATFLHERITREDKQKLVVLVLCPLLNLVDQWVLEARGFGINAVRCYGAMSSWKPYLEAGLQNLDSEGDFLMVIATNQTFRGAAFQEVWNSISVNQFLIADEMHNLGAAQLLKSLPTSVNFRLGLSATPERWFDDEGTSKLLDYFGETIFTFSMREAIESGVLTPYKYYPVVVTLDEEESDEYMKLSIQISKLVAQSSDSVEIGSGFSPLKSLLLRRSKILDGASGKLPALRIEVSNRLDRPFQLVYCGAVSLDDDADSGDSIRQIESALKIIGTELGQSATVYTSATPLNERNEILRRFGEGRDLDFLLSMRCLDEGVDIPDARIAYLIASTSNPRQFIQRRGRVLRRAEGKDFAEIIDFIVVPRSEDNSSLVANIERRLFQKELRRVIEFADLALNGDEALGKLLDIRRQYNLLDA